MQVGGAASPAAAVAFGQEPHDGRKLGAGERPIGVGPAHQIEEPVLVVVLGGDDRDELLGEHIDGTRRHREPVELPPARGLEEGAALDEIVAAQGEQPALGQPRDGVAGTPDALEQGRDGARARYLTAQIYLAHVDAELERCGRDQGPEATLFEPRLGGQAVFARQATVVGRDAGGFAARVQALAQVPRDPLGHAPGVDEDDGRAVARYQIGETVVDLAPHLVRHDGREWALRQHEAQVPGTPVAHVHDVARALAAEIAGDLIDGPLGGREPDAPQGFPGQGIETRQAEREVGAALRRGHRMDLVHDHRVGGLEHRPPARTGQQDIEGFRGRDQDVRRRAAHAQALGRGGVAGAHPRPDRDVGRPQPLELAGDPRKRRFEVAMDVVAERLERRDVDDRRRIGEPSALGLAHQSIDDGEKGRERLARSRGGRDEGVPAFQDRGPGLYLAGRRRREPAGEPVPDGRVEVIDRSQASPNFVGLTALHESGTVERVASGRSLRHERPQSRHSALRRSSNEALGRLPGL